MAFLDWSESLTLGFRIMDSDHKKLVEIVNKIHQLSAQPTTPAVALAGLDELINFTKTHFTHEETLMRKTAYPQFIPHKIEHDRLLSQIDDLRKRFEAGQVGLSQDTVVYLRTWLCDHIIKVDRFLAEWLLKYEPQA